MADKNSEEEVVVEKKSGGNMVLIIIIVLLVLLLVGGGAVAYFLLSGSDETATAETVSPQTKSMKNTKKRTKRSTDYLTVGPMYPMNQFIVNLLSENGGRFLKTTVNLEMDKPELSAELDKKKPLIRDIIIRTLSSKTFEEVSTIKGKDRLKDEIVSKINDVLTDGQIKDIFFTDFVVQ